MARQLRILFVSQFRAVSSRDVIDPFLPVFAAKKNGQPVPLRADVGSTSSKLRCEKHVTAVIRLATQSMASLLPTVVSFRGVGRHQPSGVGGSNCSRQSNVTKKLNNSDYDRFVWN